MLLGSQCVLRSVFNRNPYYSMADSFLERLNGVWLSLEDLGLLKAAAGEAQRVQREATWASQ